MNLIGYNISISGPCLAVDSVIFSVYPRRKSYLLRFLRVRAPVYDVSIDLWVRLISPWFIPCSYIFLEWIWYYLCSCLYLMFGRSSLDSVSTSKTMRCSFSAIVFRSVLFLKIQLMSETFVLSLIHNLHDDFQLPVIIQSPFLDMCDLRVVGFEFWEQVEFATDDNLQGMHFDMGECHLYQPCSVQFYFFPVFLEFIVYIFMICFLR